MTNEKDHSGLTRLLFALAASPGPAGAEGAAADLAAAELSKYAAVSRDALGNIIGEITPPHASGHLLLEAHIDEVGFIVTALDGGFLRVSQTGGIDRRILPAQEVTIWGANPVSGVFSVTPPHLAGAKDGDKLAELSDMMIDTGLSEESLNESVRIGDRVTYKQEPAALLGTRVTAKSLDNRAGVTAVLRCLQLLGTEHQRRITVLFSVQEEIGTRGAVTGGFSSDAEEAIVVDTSFAKTPDSPAHKCGVMGDGPMIGIAPVLNRGIFDRFCALAESEDIPHQIEVMADETGTNADALTLSKSGRHTGLLSIPLKYMHTACETLDVEDIENTAKLLKSYILKGGPDDGLSEESL